MNATLSLDTPPSGLAPVAPAVALAAVPAPTLDDDAELHRLLRRGAAVLLFGLGGFLATAAWVPMDEALAGHGSVAVAGQRKAVQHADGGTVATLAVRDGDAVARGQTLLTLDVMPQRAELAALERQQLALQASAQRLRALLDGQSTLDFSAELLDRATRVDDGARTLAIQRALFGSQRQGSAHEGRELAARQAQLQADIDGRREQLARQVEQRALVEQQLASIEGLARDGYYPQVRVLDAQRQLAATRLDEARGRTELQRQQEALAEARSGAGRRGGEERRDWESALLDAERQQAQLLPRLAALRHQIDAAQVTAPVAGRVVALAVHTVGGVVRAGERLMDIVPDDDALVVEARFALGAGEKLAEGQAAELRLPTMDQTRTPALAGRVLTVSADKLEDGRSGEPYLLVRVEVPAAERQRLRQASGATLRPGLPAEVFVSLGERSLLAQAVKPLTDRLRRSFVN